VELKKAKQAVHGEQSTSLSGNLSSTKGKPTECNIDPIYKRRNVGGDFVSQLTRIAILFLDLLVM
jgi:hypothetical protein